MYEYLGPLKRERLPMLKPVDVWLAAGVRTPFAKIAGLLQALDAPELSVPVAQPRSQPT